MMDKNAAAKVAKTMVADVPVSRRALVTSAAARRSRRRSAEGRSSSGVRPIAAREGTRRRRRWRIEYGGNGECRSRLENPRQEW